ncbi:uncharacterized protein PAC_02991 [Phialocephala subalpina]|uniref:FAD-binding domain-containing protein n=1 Tax=Phialocephala subalpina TaxID=576137 RepID=A0A1L7WK52_9HELO|nr:uncharacterized protein PAC_02991 [Phialocephala subalpina]
MQECFDEIGIEHESWVFILWNGKVTMTLNGSFFAIALHKHGIKSIIYEHHPEGIVGGSMGLTSNALRCLEHIGVYEELRPLGVPVDGFPIMNLKGDTVKTFVLGSEEKYGYSALRIRRNLLRQTLLKAIAQLGIEIKCNMRCFSVEETSIARQYDLCPEKVLRRRDCIQSTMGIGHFGFAKIESLIHGPDASEMKLIIGSGGAFGVIPAADDEVWFFNTAETHDRSKEEWKALEGDQEQLKETLKHPFADEPWPDIVRELVTITPVENYFCWPFQNVPEIESWVSSRGRLVILGDAAHHIPPSAGQGTAMAFEDALTLANTISTIRKQAEKSPTGNMKNALLKWEKARKTRIERVLIERERQKLRAENDDNEVDWFYSYDAGAFDVEKD